MVAEVAKLGFDRDMVVDSLRKRQQNKARRPWACSRLGNQYLLTPRSSVLHTKQPGAAARACSRLR